MTSCKLKLSESGRVTGNLNISYSDYGAVSFRRKFSTYTSIDEYLEAFEKKNAGMQVEEYENNVEESFHGNVQESMFVEIDGKVTRIGDMITFNPVFIDRLEMNPFKLEKRAYPVDFKTPVREMSIFSLLLPEGYKVEQLPESVSMVTQNNSATFQYRTQQTGQYIQMVILYEIKKPVFFEVEYEELKMFFNLIVQKEQENIILKKDPGHNSNDEAGPVANVPGSAGSF
jgi:hypothetical protein